MGVALAAVFATAGGAVCQLAPQAGPMVVTPQASRTVVLPPGGSCSLEISIPPASFAFVAIDQLQGMVSASIEGEVPSVPFASDAGAHSVIKIPVQGVAQGRVRLLVHSRDRFLPVKLSVGMTEPHPMEAADKDVFEAYRAYAQAEAMRRSRETGGHPTALELYAGAIALAQKTSDRLLEEQAWIGESRFAVYDMGNYTLGLSSAQHGTALIASEDMAAPGAAMAIAAHGLKNLSTVEVFLARYADGIEAGTRSLELYRRLGDLYWQGILEGNLANVYLEMGDTTYAQASSEQALAIAQELQDFSGIAFTMATLGAIHGMRGEYQAALDANQAALDALGKAPDDDEAGQIWINQAGIYEDLGDAEHERGALLTGLALLRRAHDAANTSSALSSLAMLEIRQQRLADASRHLAESLSLAQSQHLKRELCMAELGEARLLARRGRRKAAMEQLQEGVAQSAAGNEAESHAFLLDAEGDLLAELGQEAEALDAYRKAETAWVEMLDTEEASLTRSEIARVEFREGQRAAALGDILMAIDGFETARRQIGSRDLNESFFAARQGSFSLAVAILMSAQSGRRGSGNVERAWEIAEQARAQILMNAIRSSRQLSTQPLPAATMEKRAAVESEIAEAEKDVFRLGGQARTADDPSLRRAEGRLHSLVFQSDQIQASNREGAAWATADLLPPAPADIERRLLDGHTALIEYWVGRDAIFRWTFTSSGLTGCRLPDSASLLRQIDRFKHLLVAREEHPAGEDFATREARIAQADREAERVALRLGPGLLPAMNSSIHRLILVPDGPLASLPFAALRQRSGHWLVESYEIEVEPSAAIALALEQRPPLASANQIAVFADPVYSRDDPRLEPASGASGVAVKAAGEPHLIRAASTFDANLLPRLTGSAKEAEAIERIAGASRTRLYLGFRATPERVMQSSWSHFEILHFATHAIVNFEQPELSGIVLSMVDRQGRPEDGILWMHDIYRTWFPVPLVVVDGCSTANGKNIPGEGITGFAQAFLASGASGVLASLWTVDDDAAGRLIPILYRGLMDQRLRAPAALRAAQLKLLADPGLHAPYEWAGFVFEGNGQWQANSPNF